MTVSAILGVLFGLIVLVEVIIIGTRRKMIAAAGQAVCMGAGMLGSVTGLIVWTITTWTLLGGIATGIAISVTLGVLLHYRFKQLA